MAQGRHPSDVELFAHVEEDAPDPAVAAHVAACPACADQLAQLERGRAALRASLLLALPPRRRAALLAALPRQARERHPFLLSWRGLAAGLAPVAAALAAIVIFAGSGGEPRREQQLAGVQKSQSEASQLAADQTLAQHEPQAVASVAGTPRTVAARLRDAGLRTRVVAGTVEVSGADRQELERALAQLGEGPTPVVAVP